MNTLLSRIIVARGLRPARRLLEARREPARVQAETLRRILGANLDCDFGRRHGFQRRMSPAEYAAAVPIRDYEGFRPDVERMLRGEPRVLSQEAPFMFGTTSGTTSHRKFVPINASWARALSSAMRLWLARSTRAHPELWRGQVLTLVGSAFEGSVECGLPCGSVSGLTSMRVPRSVKQRYVLPPQVAELSDYDTRYQVAARLMLEAQVSLVAVPNATTLLRLADVGNAYSEAIVSGVRDGRLNVAANNAADADLLRQIEAHCRPDAARSHELELLRRHHDGLWPKFAWPGLSMIGCWLGGTAGVFAQRLSKSYGNAPLRDLGLRATEATMTLTLEDNTTGGVPLIRDNYYEFVPESEDPLTAASTLDPTQLELGGRYYVLLTTPAGLYRYNISDVVEVVGMYHALPLLAFVHKGPDMLNMTGEKVHADQVARAVQSAGDALCVDIARAQAIPDLNSGRYDVLLETSSEHIAALASAIDTELQRLNPEYQAKRASGRLSALHPVRMRAGWGEKLKSADVAKGSRESQYKWPFVRHQWDNVSRAEVDEASRG